MVHRARYVQRKARTHGYVEKMKGNAWVGPLRIDKSMGLSFARCLFSGAFAVSFRDGREVFSYIYPLKYPNVARWWFQIFFIFTPLWRRFPILTSIFFRWVVKNHQLVFA